MSANIQKRLEVLKSYRDDELKQSNPSKPYLDDLEQSIAQLEQLLKSGYSIIDSESYSKIDTKV